MAFSSLAVHMGEVIFPPANPQTVSALAAAITTNTASLSAIGGASAVAAGVLGFLKAYRNCGDPQAQGALSADRIVSIAASSTSSLVTIQVQIKAVV